MNFFTCGDALRAPTFCTIYIDGIIYYAFEQICFLACFLKRKKPLERERYFHAFEAAQCIGRDLQLSYYLRDTCPSVMADERVRPSA